MSTEERFRTAAEIYRVGLTAAIEAIDSIEGWTTPEDEALTVELLTTLRNCLTQGDALR